MFKVFLLLCVIIFIPLLVCADLESDAEILISKLKHEVAEKVKTFHEKSVEWLNEVIEAVPQFVEAEKEKVKSQLNDINQEIENLKRINTGCVDEHKRDIANLESFGNSFNACSTHSNANAIRNVGLVQSQVVEIEDITNSYDKELADCAKGSKCLKALLYNLKRNIKEFPAQLETYIKDARYLTEVEIDDLKKCSVADELLWEGIGIIIKIQNCIS